MFGRDDEDDRLLRLLPATLPQWYQLAKRLPGARRQWEAVKIQTVMAPEVVTRTGIRPRSVTLGASLEKILAMRTG